MLHPPVGPLETKTLSIQLEYGEGHDALEGIKGTDISKSGWGLNHHTGIQNVEIMETCLF